MADGDALRAEVLAAIAGERDGWDRLVAEVGSRREQPGVQREWWFVQIAAHLNARAHRAWDVLEAEAHGNEPPPPPWPANATEADSVNAWFEERARGQSADTIPASAAEFYDRRARVVVDVPAERLDDPVAFPSLDGQSLAGSIASGDFFGHLHEEHEPGIRCWLPANG